MVEKSLCVTGTAAYNLISRAGALCKIQTASKDVWPLASANPT